MSVVAPPIAARDAEREPAGLLTRLHEWVVTVDHKRLGIMYVVSGLAFLLIAGLEAAVIRWQLAAAGNTIVSPQVFNRLFTVHGTTMAPAQRPTSDGSPMRHSPGGPSRRATARITGTSPSS